MFIRAVLVICCQQWSTTDWYKCYKWERIPPTNTTALNPYGAWCWKITCISSSSLSQELVGEQFSDILFYRHFKAVSLVKHFTSWVPVNVCDIAGGTFTNANSFAGEYIVNIYKIIMGSHSQVLSWFCKEETPRLLKLYMVSLLLLCIFATVAHLKAPVRGGPHYTIASTNTELLTI